MSTAYPLVLDDFPNLVDRTPLEGANAFTGHTALHANANDAIEALQARVGIVNSTDTASIEYRLSHVPLGYDHTQSSAASTWTIAHNLGYRPSVSAFSVGGVEMIASVTHLSINTLQLDFNLPVAGSARLS